MLRLQELLDREAGGVREDLWDEAVGELGGGAGDLRRRHDLRRLSQQQQRLRQRVHGLRLRRCGCVAAAATSVLPATSSVLAVPPSQPPSFRQKSSIVSLFIVQSSPSTDLFTTVMFPVRSSISPNPFATVRACLCAAPLAIPRRNLPPVRPC